MKYLYKYPQAAFPYADLVETSRSRVAHRVRVRAARHGRLRRGSLLRRVRRVRQGVARRHPDRDQRPQPRPRGGRAPPPADALVPQPLVVAAPRSGPIAAAGRRAAPATRRPRRLDAGSSASGYLYCDRRRAAAVHRERDQHRSGIFGVPNRTPVRQGRHQQLRRPRRKQAVNPEKTRHQGRGPLPARPSPPARHASFGCA